MGRALATGVQRWQQSFDTPSTGRDLTPVSLTMSRSNDSRTVFAGGTLDASVIALNATSGEQLWSKARQYVSSSGTGVTVLTASPDGPLRALDTTTGDARWRYRVPPKLTEGDAATELQVRNAMGRLTISTVCDKG